MTQPATETVRLTDGRALRITVAHPERAVRGGIVVLHGNAAIVPALATALATEGWLTVAPNLDGDNDGRILDDFDAAGVWLAQRDVPSDRIGVLGFDLGGAAAVAVAAKRSIGAAISVSAPGFDAPPSEALPPLHEVAGALCCPWLGIFGTDDSGLDEDRLERLRRTAAGSEVASDVVRLPGADHRFDRDPDSADEARQRVLNWFDAHLR